MSNYIGVECYREADVYLFQGELSDIIPKLRDDWPCLETLRVFSLKPTTELFQGATSEKMKFPCTRLKLEYTLDAGDTLEELTDRLKKLLSELPEEIAQAEKQRLIGILQGDKSTGQ